MTTPDEAAAEAVQWEAERQAACLSIARARADAADQAEAERRQAERERTHADPDLQQFMARMTGRPLLSPLEAIAAHQMAAPPEQDGPGRDPAATYGTEGRPAVLVGMADGALVDIGARGVARSASEVADDELLARARASSADTWMAVRLAAFHRRRGEASRARDQAVARAEPGTGWPEISR